MPEAGPAFGTGKGLYSTLLPCEPCFSPLWSGLGWDGSRVQTTSARHCPSLAPGDRSLPAPSHLVAHLRAMHRRMASGRMGGRGAGCVVFARSPIHMRESLADRNGGVQAYLLSERRYTRVNPILGRLNSCHLAPRYGIPHQFIHWAHTGERGTQRRGRHLLHPQKKAHQISPSHPQQHVPSSLPRLSNRRHSALGPPACSRPACSAVGGAKRPRLLYT